MNLRESIGEVIVTINLIFSGAAIFFMATKITLGIIRAIKSRKKKGSDSNAWL